MNTGAASFDDRDDSGHGDGVAALSVECGDDQHVALFHFGEQTRELRPLRDGDGARDRFGDDAKGFNGKASSFDCVDPAFFGGEGAVRS